MHDNSKTFYFFSTKSFTGYTLSQIFREVVLENPGYYELSLCYVALSKKNNQTNKNKDKKI